MKKAVKSYSEKSISVLEKDLSNLRKDIALLQLSSHTKVQKDTNALIKKKKELAVLLTILKQKQLTLSTKEK